MSLKSFQNKVNNFLELIRFKNPIGFMLLLWPCWYGLASIQDNINVELKWYILFLIGAFFMRSAGCIINDLMDINIDKNIKRTANRPLISKSISVSEAFIFLSLLLFISFLILIQFNIPTIMLGLSCFPLIILYPLMKRITYWPQLFLGIIFSWGVLIVSIQFIGHISVQMFLLYIGCIFWTLGYDTIYAYQDIEDDIKNNVKSTAVLFKTNEKYIVTAFYVISLTCIGFANFQDSSSITSILLIITLMVIVIFLLNKWNPKSSISSNLYFKLNNILGLICFIYIIFF